MRDIETTLGSAFLSFPRLWVLSGIFLLSLQSPHPLSQSYCLAKPSFALGSLSPIPFKKTSLLIVNNSLRLINSYLLRACYGLGPLHVVHIISWNLTQPCKEHAPLSVDEETRLSEAEHLTQGLKLESDRSWTQPWAIWLQSLSRLLLGCTALQTMAEPGSSMGLPPDLSQLELPPWAAPDSKQSSPDYLPLLFEANPSLMRSLGRGFVFDVGSSFSLFI